MRATYIFLPEAMALSSCSTKQTDDTRPNIIVVLVDDMGFSDIGCYGWCATPVGSW